LRGVYYDVAAVRAFWVARLLGVSEDRWRVADHEGNEVVIVSG
jgi:hypothetical protein